LILAPLFLGLPVITKVENVRRYLAFLAMAFLIAGFSFLAINYPLLNNYHTFLTGLTSIANQTVSGQTLYISAWQYAMCFHLIHSLLPDLTFIVTTLALAWI